MILNRLGNKKMIAKDLVKFFPPHQTYIEPFFGAGGIFFNKPASRFNVVNDLAGEVFNLYQVVLNNRKELLREFTLMPIHYDLMQYWKKNPEPDPVRKALKVAAFFAIGKKHN